MLSGDDSGALFFSDPPPDRADKVGVRECLTDCFSSLATPPAFAVLQPDLGLGFRVQVACIMDKATAMPVKVTVEELAIGTNVKDGHKK